MSRRTNAQIDADKLRDAADVLEAIKAAPHMAVVLRVLATSVEEGKRVKEV